MGEQVPDPSQESGLSQSVLEELPQAVPAETKRSVGQAPAPSQYSERSHSSPGRQMVAELAYRGRQVPVALHESARLHVVTVGSPQAVNSAALVSAGHDPAPLQYSVTSQPVVSAGRHTKVESS